MANLTLATLVAAVRGLLLDTVPPFQWPDSALQPAVQEACGQYSYLFPRRTRQVYTVGAGAQVFSIYPVDTLANGSAAAQAVSPDNADLISVERVELPIGTVLPRDVDHIVDPTLSGSTLYRQAWRWPGGSPFLYLRNPAADLEVGASTLAVEILQTYSFPDVANTFAWNGPVHDLPLLYLLAQRSAYQQLAGWQMRDGAAPKIDAVRLLASLEIEIARALRLRRGRAVQSRTLDVS